MIYSPYQYAEALYGVLEGKAEGERVEMLRNFLRVLEKHRQTKFLERILAHYERIYLKKQGMRKVDVESASPLEAAVRQEIETILGQKVLLTEKHNPELIAGLTLSIDDSLFIDASAKKIISNLFT